MAKSREYSRDYLEKEYAAMRFFASYGATAEEIREMEWGVVGGIGVGDRDVKVSIPAKMAVLDPTTNEVEWSDYHHSDAVRADETECAWFFLKSGHRCPWMFTEHSPLAWRKEGSREALFPLEKVREVIAGAEIVELPSTNTLTIAAEFATLEIADLNISITKAKQELDSATKEALEELYAKKLELAP